MNKKCAIIGAGAVGATIAYTLCASGLFSDIALIDIDKKRAEGEAMDISDGIPFLAPVRVYAAQYSDIGDAGVVIITAGATQKEGESRLALLEKNIVIYDEIIYNLKRYNEGAIYIAVSNPVDILTYYMQLRMGVPAWRILGSGTVLDTARLKQMVARYFAVDSRNVHSFIIGEHGDSELAVWSSANISGINLDDYSKMQKRVYEREVFEDMFVRVRDSAYRIIEGKGATYYGIAQAVLRIVRSIMRGENSILTVSSFIDGHYGLSNICLGVPAIVGSCGVKEVLDIPLDGDEKQRLLESAEVIHDELKRVQVHFI